MGLRSNQVSVLTNAGTASVDLTTTDGSTLLAGGVGVQKMQLLAAKATTSGTYVDFTGIPAWAKKLTVMFNGVSTNGSSIVQVQIGSGSVTTSGYVCTTTGGSTGLISAGSTTGLRVDAASSSAFTRSGIVQVCLLGSNAYVFAGTVSDTAGNVFCQSSGNVTLTGTLDRIRLTTVNGTDLFDAGSVSVLVEGY